MSKKTRNAQHAYREHIAPEDIALGFIASAVFLIGVLITVMLNI